MSFDAIYIMCNFIRANAHYEAAFIELLTSMVLSGYVLRNLWLNHARHVF